MTAGGAVADLELQSQDAVSVKQPSTMNALPPRRAMLTCLQIAVTALCLTASVLLVALWVRSYSNGHLEGYLPAPANTCCRSIDGVVVALRLPAQTVTEQAIQTFMSSQIDSKPIDIGASETVSGFALGWHSPSFWWIQVPHWALVSVATLFAAVPWFRQPYRFSLRTLLISMTLVAVGLVVALNEFLCSRAMP